ncbi:MULTISPECIES: SH3 domain-containing protein [Pacificibacter]|uniref:SH3 domain-containing protein n=1 Tax=Pacificibacter TaxID=1042323 RepID=UPI001C082B17|nr:MULTISPECIES: SH3 domain-containing protein [Pacificibacter]MBU2937378.1 SH3 domain-containing protein [Pacificibacter marinus]MDO6615374.1 SH3 domain-containing protein [Pacificibacter sp. 1_MG-2023]
MLRLSALTLAGLLTIFLAFGGELSSDEQTELETLRAQRTSIVTVMSEAFTDTSKREPTYVATLAQIAPRKSSQKNIAHVQNASFDPAQANATPDIVSTTTVANPAKLAALMARKTNNVGKSTSNEMILRSVTANRVNVRSGPTTSNPVLGQVERADVVRVISDPNSAWVKIIIEGDGIEGYMSSRFLTPLTE